MDDNKDITTANANNAPTLTGGQQPEATTEKVVEEAVLVWGPESTQMPLASETVVVAEGAQTDGAATAADQKDDNTAETAKDDGKDKKKKDKEGDTTEKSSGVLGNKTIEDVINREAKEEQLSSSAFSVSKALGGVMIARVFQKQIGLVVLVCAFLIIYISNRYVCQKKLVEISNIEAKIQKARYKSIVCTSALTEKSRESNIMRLLQQYGDDSLRMSNEPPYLIQVKEED